MSSFSWRMKEIIGEIWGKVPFKLLKQKTKSREIPTFLVYLQAHVSGNDKGMNFFFGLHSGFSMS